MNQVLEEEKDPVHSEDAGNIVAYDVVNCVARCEKKRMEKMKAAIAEDDVAHGWCQGLIVLDGILTVDRRWRYVDGFLGRRGSLEMCICKNLGGFS